MPKKPVVKRFSDYWGVEFEEKFLAGWREEAYRIFKYWQVFHKLGELADAGNEYAGWLLALHIKGEI